MNRYHVKVKYLSDLKYGKFIEASSEEGAIRQFVDKYIYISNSAGNPESEIEERNREIEELKAEINTLKAQIRGSK